MTKFNNGILWIRKSELDGGPNKPEYYGSGHMELPVLDELIEWVKANPQLEKIPMSCSGWMKKREDDSFLSLSFSLDKRPRDHRGDLIKKDSRRGEDDEDQRRGDDDESFDSFM